jgi:CDP-diacylglycerol---glycerol-3-phosphate 3-phosphatidyltransferase
MNFPNFLTLLRTIIGFCVPAMMLIDDFQLRVWAAILFGVAAFSDWLDGWYARKYNLITKFGQILDPIADKILVLGTFLAMSSLSNIDAYSVWWVIPIFIRELVVTVYRLLFLVQPKPVVVAAEQMGKAKTLVQMFTLPFAYFYFMFAHYAQIDLPVLHYLLYALLFSSLYLTMHSGIEFFVKNWNIIRRLSLVG